MEVLHTWKVIIKKYLVTLANNFFSFNSCINQVRNIHKEHSGAHCSTANIHCFFQLQHSKHCNLVLRRRQGSHLETPSYIFTQVVTVWLMWLMKTATSHQEPWANSQDAILHLFYSLCRLPRKQKVTEKFLQLQTPVISPATIHRRVACSKTLHRNYDILHT